MLEVTQTQVPANQTHSSHELNWSDTQSLWFLGLPNNLLIHAECNTRYPNQGHSKEFRSTHKEGPNVLRTRTACAVHLPVFLVILFSFMSPLEGRGKGGKTGKKVGRGLAEGRIGGSGEWGQWLNSVTVARVLSGCLCPSFLAFLKGLYLEAPGIKRELPVLAVNSEFHSSLECPLQKEISQFYHLSTLSDNGLQIP